MLALNLLKKLGAWIWIKVIERCDQVKLHHWRLRWHRWMMKMVMLNQSNDWLSNKIILTKLVLQKVLKIMSLCIQKIKSQSQVWVQNWISQLWNQRVPLSKDQINRLLIWQGVSFQTYLGSKTLNTQKPTLQATKPR